MCTNLQIEKPENGQECAEGGANLVTPDSWPHPDFHDAAIDLPYEEMNRPIPGPNDRELIGKLRDDLVFDSRDIVKRSIPVESADLPNENAVYFLIGDDLVIYVGISSQLGFRINCHLKSKRFERVWCIYNIPRFALEHIESMYIQAWNPCLNTRRGYQPCPDESAIERLSKLKYDVAGMMQTVVMPTA